MPTGTKFTGGRAILANWYRIFWPTAHPAEVNEFTPSQIAALLWLDTETEAVAVKAVPLTDEMIEEAAREHRPSRRGPPRHRRVLDNALWEAVNPDG